MARIRTIKPEFPQSESMGRVSRDARLLFIMLWTIADDAGRLRGNSRMLASLLYPYDDDAKTLIDGWIAELSAEGCVAVYAVGNDTYVEICNWLNHQKIDKPSRSKIPPFCESSRILANPRERSSEDQGPRTEGPSTKGEDKSATPTVADAPPLVTVKARKPKAVGQRKPLLTLDEWLDTCKAKEEKTMPATDPIFEWAADAGIPIDYLRLAWIVFLRDWKTKKPQQDWRATYRNAVRQNWLKLWYFHADGDCRLTTTGEQERRAHE